MSVLTDAAESAFNQITGKAASDAAEEAAALQAQAGNRAIDVGEAAQLRLEESLAPFIQALGTDLLPQVGALFGDPSQALQNDPILGSLSKRVEDQILSSQAARGRLGADAETSQLLQSNLLNLGSDLIKRRQGSLLDALRFGQSSAAQTGVSGINTAARTGDILTQIANAQGAAGIAGQQARRQGLMDIIRAGGSFFG